MFGNTRKIHDFTKGLVHSRKVLFTFFCFINLVMSIINNRAQHSLLERDLFSIYNVFFDSDPDIFIKNLSVIQWSFVHPLLNVIRVPVKAIEWFFSCTFTDAVLIFMSGVFFIKNIVVFRLLQDLDFNDIESFVLVILFMFLGSNIVFSLVPEHFQLTSLLLLLFFRALLNTNKNSSLVIVIGALICGVTISNIISFSLCCFVAKRYFFQETTLKAVAVSSLNSFLCLLIVLCTFEVSKRLFVTKNQSLNKHESVSVLDKAKEEFKKYSVKSGAILAVNNNLKSIYNSFFLFGVSSGKVRGQCEILNKRNLPCFSFNIFNQGKTLGLIYFLAGIFFILVVFTYSFTMSKSITLFCFLPLLFNMVFHSVWGREAYLYTQHYLIFLFIPFCICLKGRVFSQIAVLTLLVPINLIFVFKNFFN